MAIHVAITRKILLANRLSTTASMERQSFLPFRERKAMKLASYELLKMK